MISIRNTLVVFRFGRFVIISDVMMCRLVYSRSVVAVTVEILVLRVACKGVGWMPWQTGPMKDVAGSDMPRGAAERALIRGSPNGGTHRP